MKKLIKSKAWKLLQRHQQKMQNKTLRELKTENYNFLQTIELKEAGIALNFAHNFCTQKTLALLDQLAKENRLQVAIQALISGAEVNRTEHRPALHTSLRNMSLDPIYVNGHNVMPDIQAVWDKMQKFSDLIRAQKYLGYSGEPIVNIVNIGIGGSELGPKMMLYALKELKTANLNFYFVSNLDPEQIHECLKSCDPKKTLFIVSSKSFETHETLVNYSIAKEWMLKTSGENNIENHFVAVTSAVEKAKVQGFKQEHIFPLWSWVGGRYSIWSATSLGLVIAIGMQNFKEFLTGAFLMDRHFIETPNTRNIPVILGLLGIWYNNFYNWNTQAVIPYAQLLVLLPEYLQQLHMESLGKHIKNNGQPVDYATGYVLWGGVGTNSQHSFHQFLLQGTTIVPCDFILPLQGETDEMMANCLAQSEILAYGHGAHSPHKIIEGNRPHNIITLNAINPRSLGALIALYEHKIYVQSIIWRIDAFDQWGVQQGKKLAQRILQLLRRRRGE